jgi:hypothetical protein
MKEKIKEIFNRTIELKLFKISKNNLHFIYQLKKFIFLEIF